MKNKVLVLYFSQTGQQLHIAKNFLYAWEKEWDIEYIEIKPKKEFLYPWTFKGFFDVFPESVLEIPCELEKIELKDDVNYNAVVFCFQIWFLHPSIPILSFASSPEFKKIISNKPVYLLCGCRNSWRYALNKIECKVIEAGGQLKSSSIYRDTAGNLAGAVSILYWLFTGKKKRFLGLFPTPGVSEETMKIARNIGTRELSELKENKAYKSESFPVLAKDFTSMDYEKYAVRRFKKWANFIVHKNRRFRLLIFKIWIVFTIVFIAPIVSLKSKIKLNKQSQTI